MTAHSSTGSPVPTSTVDEEFLDLILAEDDLLQAEFDAIVAASWSDLDRPPPRPKSPPPPAGPPGRALAMRGWVPESTPPLARSAIASQGAFAPVNQASPDKS